MYTGTIMLSASRYKWNPAQKTTAKAFFIGTGLLVNFMQTLLSAAKGSDEECDHRTNGTTSAGVHTIIGEFTVCVHTSLTSMREIGLLNQCHIMPLALKNRFTTTKES